MAKSHTRLTGPVLNLIQATSGSCGAVLSTMVVFPLDKFKARLQTGSKMSELFAELHASGVRKLWHGASSRIFEQACTKFSYFYFYSLMKVWFERKFTNGAKLGTVLNLVVGYLAAIANNGFTLPLQVVSTRIMVSKKTAGGIFTEGADILRDSGISGLYRGWRPSVVLCINPAISFAAFEQLKLRLLRRRGLHVSSSISSFDAFILGAVAKAVATVVTFPFIRVKTMMQVQNDENDNSLSDDYDGDLKINSDKKSLMQMFTSIWYKEGFHGLYVGVYPQLLKGVIAAAVLFSAKERIFELVYKTVMGVISKRTPQ